MAIQIMAIPIMTIPIMAIPIMAIPIMAIPIMAIPIMAIPIMAIPIMAIPMMAIPMMTIPILELAINSNSGAELTPTLDGIHEILTVVDSCVCVVHVGVELPVGSLLVAVYDGTVPNDPLYDRDECLCPTVRHKLHVAHTRGS